MKVVSVFQVDVISHILQVNKLRLREKRERTYGYQWGRLEGKDSQGVWG